MPELNRAALNVGPSPSAPSPTSRSRDTTANDEGGESSFGEVMAQTAASRKTAADPPAAPSKDTQATAEAPQQRPDTRKGKADRGGAEKSAPESGRAGKQSGAPAADATAADAADAAHAADDAKGLDQVASVLATIATPLPAAIAVAHAAVAFAAGKIADENAAGPDAGSDAAPTAVGKHPHPSRASGTAQTTGEERYVSSTQAPGTDTAAPRTAREAAATAGAHAHRTAPDPVTSKADAPARAHGAGDGGHTAAASPSLQARDRLIEDFQQRFERALATVASSHSSSPGDAGVLHSTAASALAGISAPSPAPGSVVQITLPTPVGAAAFTEDFSQHVAVLTRGKVHSAELSLTPADLGPVTVSIEVRGAEASLVFSASHEAARSAIEAALPRLRDMLDAQGLQLTDARVGTQAGDGSPQHGDRQRGHVHPTPAFDATNAAAATPVTQAVVLRSTRLIDVIA